MSEKCKYLPDECWELIFDTLDHHIHFQPLSLVCKRFLSITNLLCRELTVTKPTILFHGKISGFLRRFRHLKSIDISRFHHPYCVISVIANSSLSNLQVLDISNQKRVPTKGLMKLGSSKMRTLKVLKCSYIETLLDTDLFVIATSLPCLEELDISYPLNIYAHSSYTDKRAVTDIGIDALSSNLKNLCKINLSGSDFISDKSLMLLSSNCSLLREIMIKECTFLTVDGINFLLNDSPNLSSISMSFLFSYRSLDIRWANTQTSSLSTLYLSNMDISDGFLNSLTNARLPLKRLSLLHCAEFSFSGISLLLYTYQSLEYLALVVVPFLTDQNM